MKKFKNLAFIFLIIIIAILILIIYATVSIGNNKDDKSKATSEVEFLEMKIEMLLNQMNNIETRNYSVSVSEISQQTKSQQNGGSSDENSQSEQGNSESNGNSGNESSKEGGNKGNSQETEQSKKFDLEPIGVLSTEGEINWGNAKNEIEMLYKSIPTITLDLYGLNVSQDDILGFNKEFDILTTVAKKESKEETLNSLAKLYEYIPKFLKNTTNDEVKKVALDAKKELFKAYSKLDSRNWTEIGQYTKQSIDNFSKLLSTTNINSNKQYKISKSYVMLNELQNAVEVQDESVFLIKYKNILEEINNL